MPFEFYLNMLMLFHFSHTCLKVSLHQPADPLLPGTPRLPPSPAMSLSRAAGPSQSSSSARITILQLSPLFTHTGNTLDLVSTCQGFTAKHRSWDHSICPFSTHCQQICSFSFPHLESASSFSSLTSFRPLWPYLLLCPAWTILTISVSSHQEGE